MTPIEDIRAANDDRHALEDSINGAIYALKQALHYHCDLDHGKASIFTEQAEAHLHHVITLEARLVDYQGRAEGYTEAVLEAS